MSLDNKPVACKLWFMCEGLLFMALYLYHPVFIWRTWGFESREIKKEGMGRTCDMYGGEEKHTYRSDGVTWRKDNFEGQCIDDRLRFKLILKKQYGRPWPGLIGACAVFHDMVNFFSDQLLFPHPTSCWRTTTCQPVVNTYLIYLHLLSTLGSHLLHPNKGF